MSNLTRALLVLLVLVAGAISAKADSMSYAIIDTRSAGSVTTNSDGSLRLQTFDNTSNGKASVVFGTGDVLGTLGTLSNFSAEFLKSSSPATPDANIFAFRLWTTANGSQGLVWENNYNGNATIPVDSWQSKTFTGGNFWERSSGANFNGGDQALNLSTWQTGVTFNKDGNGTSVDSVPFNSSTPIYAIQVSYGSGVGAFDGSLRNVNLDFGTAVHYSSGAAPAEASTPLPSAALGGLACLGLFATGRFRRRPTAA